MESRILEIKKRLKWAFARVKFSPEINFRIKSLCSQIHRLISRRISPYIEELITMYEQLINSFTNDSVQQIVDNLVESENLFIQNLTVGLAIVANKVLDYLNKARELARSQSIDDVLPIFLTLSLIQKFNFSSTISVSQSKQTFIDFWEVNLTQYLNNFQIPPNNYLKFLAKKHICDDNTKPYIQCIVNSQKINNFMELLFGNIKNYKFYKKVAEVYELNFVRFPKDISDHTISITPTSINLRYEGSNQLIVPGKEMSANYLGLISEKFRGDGLIIFGRHPHCDIQFSEDERTIDHVALILYCAKDTYYAIDCSKSNFSYSGHKLEPFVQNPVERDQLYNFAKTMLFRVIDLVFYPPSGTQSDESDATYVYEEGKFIVHSTLIIENIIGTYIGTQFNLNTRIRNSQNIRIKHNVGAGGDGYAIDILLPRESRSSRLHASFNFEQNQWMIKDENSTNGTFLLFKNFEEFSNKRNSKCTKLFTVGKESGKTIFVGKYVFHIRL